MVLSKVVAVALAAEIVLSFAPAGASQKGWVTPDGQSWYYITDDGEYLESDWIKDGGKWYYCDETGRMVAGINDYRIDGAAYDFDSRGACTNPDAASEKLTGWQKMYYSKCKYVYNTDETVFVDYAYRWYYFEPDGSPVYGWKEIDGKWYYFIEGYFDDLGADPWMLYNDEDRPNPYMIEPNFIYYLFKPNGEMVTGWYNNGLNWYLARSNGHLYQNEWYQENGKWYYFGDSCSMYADIENVVINGIYYSFDSTGACTNPDAKAEKIVGWFKEYIDNAYYKWFYNDENGERITGWKQIDGKWYYLDPDFRGAMAADGPVYIDDEVYCFEKSGELYGDGWFRYYFDDDMYEWYYCIDGKGCKGWKQIDGTWYYFDPEYAYMYDGIIVTIDGNKYIFADNGAMKTGWCSYSNKGGATLWWYAAPDGALYVNKWLSQDGNWYYFGSDAQMVSNVEDYEINGIAYTFDENGVCQNPDATAKKSVWDKESGEWVYYDENGEKVKGWKEIDDVWYYFDPETAYMNSGNILTLNGKKYKFADDGAMCVGWSKYLNKAGTTLWWYSGPDGALYVEKWLFQDGKWYYFGSDAEMIANVKDYVVNGVAYDFDENGVCLNP